MSFVKEAENIAVKAAITGATFAAVDKYGYGASDDKLAMRAGQAAGSQAVADLTEDTIGNLVLKSDSSEQTKMLLNPIMTGGLYVASNKVLENDTKSSLYQFLEATGSSLVANQAEPFVVKSLGLQ